MRFKKVHCPGPDWKDNILTIWEEDDVNYRDKESTDQAFKRITGLDPNKWQEKYDCQDHALYLYRRGWVRCISYEGGYVGCVVSHVPMESF